MAILFRRSNGIYYHVSCQNGRRVWRSTGARRRVDAEKQVLSLKVTPKAKRNEVNEEEKPAGLILSGFLPQWMSYGETNLARTTVLLCKESIRSFIRHIGDKPLSLYTAMDMERFKSLRVSEAHL